MDKQSDEAARARLLERRVELERVADSARAATDTVELNQTRVGRLSRMDALQGQAMAQEAERRRQLERQRIDAALGRLDVGDYGYCVRCDEPIAAARLLIDPAATLCINCAQ